MEQKKAETKMLTRKEILRAPDIQIEKVEVPEWGGHVYVKTMSGSERDRFELSQNPDPKAPIEERFADLRARMAALVCVDEQGEPLFSYEDFKELGKRSAAALDRVFEVAQRLSRFKPEDIEEMAEGLPEGQGGGSASA